MELIGVLIFGGGQYWVCNQEEAWICPLAVGEWVEVLVGDEWLAMRMQSGGYHGRYLCSVDGQWMRPALCMRVRLAVCW